MPEVRLLGRAMRAALGAKKLCLPGANVAEVLEEAARRGGDAMGEALFAAPDQPEARIRFYRVMDIHVRLFASLRDRLPPAAAGRLR